MALPNGSNNE
jgi:hypothetical protein